MMENNAELIEKLKNYSFTRKGEIAKLTYDAAVAIDTLESRVRVLEKELSKSGK